MTLDSGELSDHPDPTRGFFLLAEASLLLDVPIRTLRWQLEHGRRDGMRGSGTGRPWIVHLPGQARASADDPG
jgi:hypothetical protein